MKSSEILSALKLTRNKSTMLFSSVLASIFAFVKQIANEIVSKEVSEPEFTIDDHGKLLTMQRVKELHFNQIVSNYRWNDKKVKELQAECNSLNSELTKVKDLLWKKRKNKDNSKLEAQRDALIVETDNLVQTITLMVSIEKMRLEKIEFSIEDMRKELSLFKGQKISLKTITGCYSFYVPVNNEYYRQLMLLMGIDTIKEVMPEIKPIKTILVDAEIFKSLPKAVKFTSMDDLRPAMTMVCLAMEDCKAEVVATDAHRLYQSASFESSEKERIELLISTKDAIQISKMGFDDTAEINLLPENKMSINGEVFDLLDARFPDYRVVIPEYSSYMEFNRKDMIAAVKTVMPYTNKSTNQVNFYLNGNIQLSGQDVDFSFEGGSRLAYKTKNFEDTTIAFNGKFLNDTLAIFKEEYVKMYSDGVPTKAGIFTNDTERVLIMPLMINSRW